MIRILSLMNRRKTFNEVLYESDVQHQRYTDLWKMSSTARTHQFRSDLIILLLLFSFATSSGKGWALWGGGESQKKYFRTFYISFDLFVCYRGNSQPEEVGAAREGGSATEILDTL